MADLSTLNGISEARNDLYNKALDGSVPEARAKVLDRILSGQTYLCGDLRLKFIKLVAAKRPGNVEEVAGAAIKELDRFLSPGPRALEGAS